jgi:hypothetical protein
MKLTPGRKRRLLALLTLGEPLSAACRAVGVTTVTVNRHRRQDPVFAERLSAARANRVPAFVPLDWRSAAEFLEHEFPEQWALPEMPFDLSAD